MSMPLLTEFRTRPRPAGRRRRSGLRFESLESRRLLASFVVSTTVDAVDLQPGDGVCEIAGSGCSLRAAIQESNALGDSSVPHQIELPAGVYTLTIEGSDESASGTGDLNIRTSVSILGEGAAVTVIDGGGLDRVIDVVLGTVGIQGVTVRGGNVGADEEAFEYIGGGIRNQANLTLLDSVVSGNIAGSGGGVANYNGTLKIQRSVITGNGDSTTTRGGGVFNYANYDSASLEIVESTLSGNEALTGGGMMNFGYDGVANALIQRSTIDTNTAFSGGGVANRGRLIFEDSAQANLSIRNSTISGNSATASGGGLDNQGDYGGEALADILNTTIAGNQAVGLDGGGIRSADSANALTVTRSTIIAKNTAGRSGSDLFGQSISGSFNLVGSTLGHQLVDGVDHNLVGIDPRLGPLADNGGPTLTHLLLVGSPAIDQGSNSLSLASDQRGSAFLRTVDFPAVGNASDGTDIGAVEIGQIASTFDFGDAPDGVSVGNQLRHYPTLVASDGARHRIDTLGPFLGAIRPDAESDGQTSSSASGDDLVGADDEDAFPATPIQLTPGQPIDGVIISYDGATTGAYLNVWIDINLDGDWDDSGEHLIVDRSVPAGPGITSLSALTLPATAVVGTTFLRARISSQSGLMPGGEAPDGEVEDVRATIGDAPIETADLSLRQVVDNANPNVGETVSFTITLTNDGPDRATNVEVTNLLPPELSFVQATVSRGVYEFEETWFIDVLNSGESAQLQVRAIVDSSDSSQHTAEVTFADQFDPDSTPGNGISGEDDQTTVTLGTCLSGSPLSVGMNRVTYSCASPGAWVGFVHGSERGTKTFEQYDVTVDIADASGVAIAIADLQGVASALIPISQEELNAAVDQSGELIVQAFEMLPRRGKSNTLSITDEVLMLRAERIGQGGQPLEEGLVRPVAQAALLQWLRLPLPDPLRMRLEAAKVVVSDLPGDALARVVGRTIVLDSDAAGNGWFVDPTPTENEEYVLSTFGHMDAVDLTAARRVDLLTALTHEFGHLLGLADASVPNSVMYRRLATGERRMLAPNTNRQLPLDVNADNRVTSLDALQIINWLGRQSLTTDSEQTFWVGENAVDALFLDTNADYRVSASDALLIINHLSSVDGIEGESTWSAPSQIVLEPLNTRSHRDTVEIESLDLMPVRVPTPMPGTWMPVVPGEYRERDERDLAISDDVETLDEALLQIDWEAEVHGQNDD